MKPSDLTLNQRRLLIILVERSNRGLREVDLKDFGSVGGMKHLIRKGAVMVTRTLCGERGGEYPQILPTREGLRVADYIVVNRLKTY